MSRDCYLTIESPDTEATVDFLSSISDGLETPGITVKLSLITLSAVTGERGLHVQVQADDSAATILLDVVLDVPMEEVDKEEEDNRAFRLSEGDIDAESEEDL